MGSWGPTEWVAFFGAAATFVGALAAAAVTIINALKGVQRQVNQLSGELADHEQNAQARTVKVLNEVAPAPTLEPHRLYEGPPPFDEGRKPPLP